MKNLLSKLLGKLRPKQAPKPEQLPNIFTSPTARKGRVIKAKSAPEYEPGKSNKGGRVVRNIPKQLKKMKEAQETNMMPHISDLGSETNVPYPGYVPKGTGSARLVDGK